MNSITSICAHIPYKVQLKNLGNKKNRSKELLLSIPGAFMGFPHAFFGPTPMAPRIPRVTFRGVDGMSRHLGDDKTNLGDGYPVLWEL